MKKQDIGSNLQKKILLNFLFPAFLGWAIYHFVARALEFTNLIEAAIYWILAMALECSPKTEPEVMRESGAERRRNSHETEKTHTGRSHQKAA